MKIIIFKNVRKFRHTIRWTILQFSSIDTGKVHPFIQSVQATRPRPKLFDAAVWPWPLLRKVQVRNAAKQISKKNRKKKTSQGKKWKLFSRMNFENGENFVRSFACKTCCNYITRFGAPVQPAGWLTCVALCSFLTFFLLKSACTNGQTAVHFSATALENKGHRWMKPVAMHRALILRRNLNVWNFR